jgi:prevent-host-death family protein
MNRSNGMTQSGDREFGAFEAKNKFAALLDRVERGDEIVITRHGRPVARLVPNAGFIDRAEARAAFDRIRAAAVELNSGPFDWDEFKNDRDAGRPGMDL